MTVRSKKQGMRTDDLVLLRAARLEAAFARASSRPLIVRQA